MRVIRTASAFREALFEERACGRRVGLVPTMGALHAGHRSLVERAARECDVVAVTIFVNPLQFDDPSDLAEYPRELESDVEKASSAGAGVVFAPPIREIYPGHPVQPAARVCMGSLGDVLEGASRPGHFEGVATVVTKLFALAGPCRSYFGEKDFQQLAVIRALVTELLLPVEVVACPTVRDPDGLAMSSRNVRLSSVERKAALSLRRSLEAGASALGDGERDLEVVRSVMKAEMALEPLVECDYAEVVDAATLGAPGVTSELQLLVAARVGDVRLIDNMGAVLRPELEARDLARASTKGARA